MVEGVARGGEKQVRGSAEYLFYLELAEDSGVGMREMRMQAIEGSPVFWIIAFVDPGDSLEPQSLCKAP